MASSMVYIVIMAIAFVAFVCLATILIITRKKEKEVFLSDEYEEETESVRRKSKKQQMQEEFEEDDPEPSRMQDHADFGYSERNPIFTSSSAASERYLSALRTERGEGLRWIREGTVTVKKLNQISNVNVECYTLYLYGKEYKQIYICPSGRRNSSDAPKGLILASDGKRLSYSGSISLEAKEKGITEEQVLEKYAFVYENRRSADSGNSKKTSSAAARKKEYDRLESASYKADFSTDDRKEKEYSQKSGSLERPATQKTEDSRRTSFPNYLPGFEPEEMKPALDKFLAVMDREYPDGVIKGDTWDHDRWDRAASMLCKYLGYANGSEFLEAYGYTVEK